MWGNGVDFGTYLSTYTTPTSLFDLDVLQLGLSPLRQREKFCKGTDISKIDGPAGKKEQKKADIYGRWARVENEMLNQCNESCNNNA